MTVAVNYSNAEVGISATLINVEVHVSPDLPQVLIVGLPKKVVLESKDRVREGTSAKAFQCSDIWRLSR